LGDGRWPFFRILGQVIPSQRGLIDRFLRHDVPLTGVPDILPLNSVTLFGSGERKRLRKQGKTMAAALSEWNVEYILTRRVVTRVGRAFAGVAGPLSTR